MVLKNLKELYEELSWVRTKIANQIVIESGLIDYLKEKRVSILVENGTYKVGKKHLNWKDWNYREPSKQWNIVCEKIYKLIDHDEFTSIYEILMETTLLIIY